MYRHTLLAMLIALMLAPALAQAQTTEPVGTVTTGDDEVARAYDNPNAYFEVTIGVMVLGTIHDSEDQASRSARSIASIFSAALTSDPTEDFEFGESEVLETSQLGDESFAHRVPFTMFGSFEGQYIILAIRQATWVQVMVGFGVGNVDVLADLEAIAAKTLPRWPSDDPIALREDGLRTGGIWNMTPMPEDMPEGYVLDEGFEEGPAASVSDVVPVGTPEPAATDPVATPDRIVPEEATPEPAAPDTEETPEPTATGPDATTPPIEELATPEPTEPVATPEATATPEEPTATETDVADPTVPPATPEVTATATLATPEPTVTDAAATPEPAATEEDGRDLPLIPTEEASPTAAPDATATAATVDEQATPTPSVQLPSGIATPDGINPRLALPFDVKVEIILPLDNAVVGEDGSCSGAGLLDGLTDGATLTLRTGEGGSLVSTAPVTGPGIIAYDTVDRQEVCYFSASFTDVPPRAQYTLLAGESVLGRLTFEELHTGQPVLVVLGGD